MDEKRYIEKNRLVNFYFSWSFLAAKVEESLDD